MPRAPDYLEPLVGWRVWDVVALGGGLRLCSPLYLSTWPLRQELVAECRPRAEDALTLLQSGRFSHASPDAKCGCGIYAGESPAQAVAYLSRFFKSHRNAAHRVLGRVSLWGSVLESERGWRASHAYPARVYIPVPTRRRLLGGLKRPRLSATDIALGLAEYGVPVELVECATAHELAEMLAETSDDLGARRAAA